MSPVADARSVSVDELEALREENKRLKASVEKAEQILLNVKSAFEAVENNRRKAEGEKHAANGSATNGVESSHSDGVPAVSRVRAPPQSGPFSEDYYKGFLSELSSSRMPSAIRGLFPLELTPGVLSLLAGKPNPLTFPIRAIQLTVTSPDDPSVEVNLEIKGKDMAEALQYGPTKGMAALVRWFEELQNEVHGRAQGEGWRISVGAGSQDLLYKAFLALLDRADSVLIEAPVYAGVIPMIDSIGCEIIEIPTDYDGIDSSFLERLLDSWPAGKPYPKALYTVPYGCNPSGATAPNSRRVQVLDLARKYNFLIMEDDPYYYLYYGKAERPTSYFKMEKQDGKGIGHVLRFDSLSKILSSGLRIGWVSGPTTLVDAIDLHTSTANLQASSTAQAITYAYLNYVGIDGFLKHTGKVSEFYGEKAATFGASMEKHLKGLATWAAPNAGMFLWFKLLLPPAKDSEDGDSASLIRTKAYENGVLALPGTAFYPKGQPTPYVRAAFSLLSDEDADEALRRLAEVVQQVRDEA